MGSVCHRDGLFGNAKHDASNTMWLYHGLLERSSAACLHLLPR